MPISFTRRWPARDAAAARVSRGPFDVISFAQNFEDLILSRVFRGRQHGVYVDIGAHFPITDSVTEHFYRLGWRGINVEPLEAAFAELCASRSEDLNLNCVVGADDGKARFFTLDGFSTIDETIADAHRAEGRDSREITVEMLTLATVLGRLHGKRVDFLKIDVEGAEVTVLKSNDWMRLRPSIVLIEAIHPITHAPSHDAWEYILLDAKYELVHFDGLNRFYWNTELDRPNSDCFLPPNALDNVTCYPQLAAEARASEFARMAQYEQQKSAQIEAIAAQQVEATKRQIFEIDKALTLFSNGFQTGMPSDAVKEGWHALLAFESSRQRAEEARLHSVNKALIALGTGDNATAPHTALETGWQCLKDSRARLIFEYDSRLASKEAEVANLKSQLAVSLAACQENQGLLEVSEQRRLAYLDANLGLGGASPRLETQQSSVATDSSPALSSFHIGRSARLFATRQDLLLSLEIGAGCTVAELGVALGDFSAFILDHLQPHQFVAFDLFDMHTYPSHWGTPSEVLFEGLSHRAFYERRFAAYAKKITIELGDSRTTLSTYEDNFFDLVYIDAGHTYDHVRHDAEMALRKLREGGVLMFNDYIMYDHHLNTPYGVVQAVNELVLEHRLKVIGFGLQRDMFCDIAIRKE